MDAHEMFMHFYQDAEKDLREKWGEDAEFPVAADQLWVLHKGGFNINPNPKKMTSEQYKNLEESIFDVKKNIVELTAEVNKKPSWMQIIGVVAPLTGVITTILLAGMGFFWNEMKSHQQHIHQEFEKSQTKQNEFYNRILEEHKKHVHSGAVTHDQLNLILKSKKKEN